MSRHSTIESAMLLMLAPLDKKNGGVFTQLTSFTNADFDAAINQLVRSKPPVCLLVSLGMKPSQLRANNAHDETFQITLLIAARNLHGQSATRKGGATTPGVYDLLDQTHAKLLGQTIPAMDVGVIQPGIERLFAVRGETIIWRQDWNLTRYL